MATLTVFNFPNYIYFCRLFENLICNSLFAIYLITKFNKLKIETGGEIKFYWPTGYNY